MRLFKYFFVGGAAACLDIALFSLFASYFGLPWIPVSIATFILATLLNYFLSIQFVFESGVRYEKHMELIGVFLVSGLALFVNQLVLYISIEILGVQLIVSKIIATCTVFFWNYFARSKFIF
jgi:putative flippase GtrA